MVRSYLCQKQRRAIRTALQSAQKLANSRVDHVIACISGGSPRSYGLEGTVDIKTGIVDDNDIADVLGSCEFQHMVLIERFCMHNL